MKFPPEYRTHTMIVQDRSVEVATAPSFENALDRLRDRMASVPFTCQKIGCWAGAVSIEIARKVHRQHGCGVFVVVGRVKDDRSNVFIAAPMDDSCRVLPGEPAIIVAIPAERVPTLCDTCETARLRLN